MVLLARDPEKRRRILNRLKLLGPASNANSLHTEDRESSPFLQSDVMIASHSDESAGAYRSHIDLAVSAVLRVAVASGDL